MHSQKNIKILTEDDREFLNMKKKKKKSISLVLSRELSIIIVIIPGNLTLGRNKL